MRLQKQSISKISLNDVLRRRKTSLNNFLKQSGIVSYSLLVSRCASMGITPPTLEQFLTATGTKDDAVPKLSSPTEGVIVLQPPDILKESTGKIEKKEVEETLAIYSPPIYPKKNKKAKIEKRNQKRIAPITEIDAEQNKA